MKKLLRATWVKMRAKQKLSLLTPNEPRHDDIYLVSYPKSGNTWLLFLIANVIIEYLNLDMEINFFNLHNFIPDIHMSRNIPNELRYYPFRRIIKSHSKYNPYYNNVILLIRNPSDVLISYYYYLKNSNRYAGDFSDFVKGGSGIESWVKHTGSWLRQNYNSQKLYVLCYEQLRRHPKEELRKIFKMMGFTLSDPVLDQAIDRAGFANMQRLEKETSSYYVKQYADFSFVRKGQSNQNDLLLDAETQTYIKKKSKNLIMLLNEHGYLKWDEI